MIAAAGGTLASTTIVICEALRANRGAPGVLVWRRREKNRHVSTVMAALLAADADRGMTADAEALYRSELLQAVSGSVAGVATGWPGCR